MLKVLVYFIFYLRGSLTFGCGHTVYEKENGALLLTPYIEEGRIKEGREAARVSPLLDTIESYSGYFTVNKEHHSNLFFWYFPAEETSRDSDETPVILWLNGGPGVSSLYGLLIENGPLSLKDNNTLVKRPIYWSKYYHVIYIDNPVGVGFSFTTENGLLHNETQISNAMHTALVQFFQLFPELSSNEFFVAGESYGGRYAPSIAYRIHNSNPTSNVRINLKGVMIGNGVVDMEVFYKKGVYLVQLGLLDSRELPDILKMEEKFAQAVNAHDYTTAKQLETELINSASTWTRGGVNPYNYLENHLNEEVYDNITPFFNDPPIRDLIHVGNVKFCLLSRDIHHMINEGDIFMDMSPYVEELLEHYRILYYNGQLDIVLPYPNCNEYAEKLNWNGALEYHRAPRNPWMVDGKLAGFSRSGGNLTLVLVRNAGHMVPHDQPEWALDLITKFVNGLEVV